MTLKDTEWPADDSAGEIASGTEKRGWNATRHRRAFSLLELLVSLTVLMILVGVMLPALSHSVRKARLLKCSNNLVSLHDAMTSYITEEGYMPVAGYHPLRGRFESLRSTLDEHGAEDIRIWICPADLRQTDTVSEFGSYVYPISRYMTAKGDPNARVNFDSLPQFYPIFADLGPFHRAVLNPSGREDSNARALDPPGRGGGGGSGENTPHFIPRFKPGQNRILVNRKITATDR
ncbi:MAG: type II secretion system protein [Phycisphaerales bacterium]